LGQATTQARYVLVIHRIGVDLRRQRGIVQNHPRWRPSGNQEHCCLGGGLILAAGGDIASPRPIGGDGRKRLIGIRLGRVNAAIRYNKANAEPERLVQGPPRARPNNIDFSFRGDEKSLPF